MIASLSGKVTDLLPSGVIVEIGSIGYEVFVSSRQLAELKAGEEVKLFIYDHTKEDAHNLYGFTDYESRLLFTQLLSVSGVGPKVALAILASNSTQKLSDAIGSGKSEVLQTISGVGKKTAERIVVELKSKLVGSHGIEAEAAGQDIAVAALHQLGYPYRQAKEAVMSLPADIKSDEERIKLALKQVSGSSTSLGASK